MNHRLVVAQNSGGVHTRNILPVLVVVGVIGVLGARFLGVIRKYSVNLLYLDQWGYLTPFFRHQPSIAELFFRQHGPHREGIGLIADKFLYPLTHWNSRVDSFLIGASIFAAMLLALLLKCKLYGALSSSDVAIPVIFLSLAQYETLVSVPNPAHSAFPLLLLMLYCLALLGHNWMLRYACVLVLNYLLIYTGFGLFMGLVTVGLFLLECFWCWRHMTSVPLPPALAGLSVAAVSFASFFVHYTFNPAADCFEIPHRHLLQYPRFMALMFSGFVVPRPLSVSLRMTVLGASILLVAVSVFCLHLVQLLKHPHSETHLIGAVLLGFCLLFATNTAVGRLCQGLDKAYRSRYCTLLIPGFLAIYFYLLSKSWHGKRSLVLAVWVLLLLPAALRKPRIELEWLSSRELAWAACYVRTESISYCNQSADLVLNPYPERVGLQQKLDYLKQHRLNLFYKPAK
ncbi:MAG: hypothetical protein WCA16_08580 [Candidatus Sulfotelmatobacter sp.]